MGLGADVLYILKNTVKLTDSVERLNVANAELRSRVDTLNERVVRLESRLDTYIACCGPMTSSTIGGGPKLPRHRGPQRHTADQSNQVWCWDITRLPGPIRGQFTFLYLIIDLYSRKIVGWEVHEVENSAQARDLVQRACPARSRRGVA